MPQRLSHDCFVSFCAGSGGGGGEVKVWEKSLCDVLLGSITAHPHNAVAGAELLWQVRWGPGGSHFELLYRNHKMTGNIVPCPCALPACSTVDKR